MITAIRDKTVNKEFNRKIITRKNAKKNNCVDISAN